MGKINILDESLINKIAAGEVIERPASVVKELIENSIDAGSKKIFIKIREGGKSLIQVTDDGDGMEPGDARIAFMRHATSKIKGIDDLFNISSLGFRGEALSSIAAVSSMEIKTCNGSDEGLLLVLENGKLKEEKKVVMPRGTTIIIRDLFKNVPARKKHLKTIDTELRKIIETVMDYALIYHEIYFEVLHNDKIVLNSPPTLNTKYNIANLYGANVAKNLLSVNYSSGDIEIMGEISRPGFQKNEKNYQSVYINGRHVKNKIINKAVYEGYHTFLNINKHPVFFLDVKIDPKKIDVNVHPQKLIVRLEKEEEVYNAVACAVKEALAKNENTDKVGVIRKSEVILDLGSYSINTEKQQKVISEKKKIVHDFRILGQILRTYAIVSTKEGMLIIDQHAAQERVKYENYMKQYKEKRVGEQKLLEPLIIEMTPAESILISSNLELLKNLGFEAENFGKNSFLLRTVPLIFERLQGRDVFLSVLDELKGGRTVKMDKIKEERIIRKACRASIKANDPLEIEELIGVVNDLFSAQQPYTCPHGRPTMLKFTADDLEKMFRRKGL